MLRVLGIPLLENKNRIILLSFISFSFPCFPIFLLFQAQRSGTCPRVGLSFVSLFLCSLLFPAHSSLDSSLRIAAHRCAAVPHAPQRGPTGGPEVRRFHGSWAPGDALPCPGNPRGRPRGATPKARHKWRHASSGRMERYHRRRRRKNLPFIGAGVARKDCHT